MLLCGPQGHAPSARVRMVTFTGMIQEVSAEACTCRNVLDFTGANSAAVRHRGHFSELTGIDGESAAMMRGVLDHGPYDVADGLAAHDRTLREWPREILRAAGPWKP